MLALEVQSPLRSPPITKELSYRTKCSLQEGKQDQCNLNVEHRQQRISDNQGNTSQQRTTDVLITSKDHMSRMLYSWRYL